MNKNSKCHVIMVVYIVSYNCVCNSVYIVFISLFKYIYIHICKIMYMPTAGKPYVRFASFLSIALCLGVGVGWGGGAC